MPAPRPTCRSPSSCGRDWLALAHCGRSGRRTHCLTGQRRCWRGCRSSCLAVTRGCWRCHGSGSVSGRRRRCRWGECGCRCGLGRCRCGRRGRCRSGPWGGCCRSRSRCSPGSGPGRGRRGYLRGRALAWSARQGLAGDPVAVAVQPVPVRLRPSGSFVERLGLGPRVEVGAVAVRPGGVVFQLDCVRRGCGRWRGRWRGCRRGCRRGCGRLGRRCGRGCWSSCRRLLWRGRGDGDGTLSRRGYRGGCGCRRGRRCGWLRYRCGRGRGCRV